MSAPDPAEAPVTFVFDVMVHENVVPETLFGFVIEIDVVTPEQIVWFALALASGIVFTIAALVLPVAVFDVKQLPTRFVMVTDIPEPVG
jgi:hypothetical protein